MLDLLQNVLARSPLQAHYMLNQLYLIRVGGHCTGGKNYASL